MEEQVAITGRLRYMPLLKAADVVFFDILSLPEIVPQTNDSLYTIVTGDRIDNLAYKYYNDPRLWWIIAKANNLIDIPVQFGIGDEILIPDPNYILNNYLTKVKNQ